MMERTAEFREAIDRLERGIEESLQQYLHEQLQNPQTDLPDIEKRMADLLGARQNEGEENPMTKNAYYTRPDGVIYQERDPVFAEIIDEMEAGIEQSLKNNQVVQKIFGSDEGYAERDLAFARAIDMVEEGIEQAIAELKAELNLDSLTKERDPQFAQLIDEIEASIIDITNNYLDRQAS